MKKKLFFMFSLVFNNLKNNQNNEQTNNEITQNLNLQIQKLETEIGNMKKNQNHGKNERATQVELAAQLLQVIIQDMLFNEKLEQQIKETFFSNEKVLIPGEKNFLSLLMQLLFLFCSLICTEVSNYKEIVISWTGFVAGSYVLLRYFISRCHMIKHSNTKLTLFSFVFFFGIIIKNYIDNKARENFIEKLLVFNLFIQKKNGKEKVYRKTQIIFCGFLFLCVLGEFYFFFKNIKINGFWCPLSDSCLLVIFLYSIFICPGKTNTSLV